MVSPGDELVAEPVVEVTAEREPAPAPVAGEKRTGPPRLVEGEDYYWEGQYMVMTEHYLRKRGYCCESGCRHCPYGFKRSK